MSKNVVTFFLFFALVTGCKTIKKTTVLSDSNPTETDSILVPIDTVMFHITNNGDTLTNLEEEISIGVHKVRKDTIILSAVGDIMIGTNFPSSSYLPESNGDRLWAEVRPYLQKTDVTFGNLEGVILTEGGEQKECNNPKICYLFRMPDYLSFQFSEAGFDLLSIANNHSNDFGETGRKNTQRVLDSLNIVHAGSLENPYSIIRKKGYSLGFVAFSPNKGTLNINDQEGALKIINYLDSLTDIVIVSMHAGAEGSKNQHITRNREFYFGEDRGNVYEFAHKLIDAGADVILGHGPHVVRAIEVYNRKLIAYSLGNFLTYGRFNLKGPNALAPILEIYISDNGDFLSGEIHSFIQDYQLGPILDIEKRALRSIQELSKIDFPENEISIDEKGKILYLER